MPRPRLTLKDLKDLPPVMSVPEAGRLLGLGYTRSYAEARRPGGAIPVIEAGERKLLVPTALLLAKLGLGDGVTGEVGS